MASEASQGAQVWLECGEFKYLAIRRPRDRPESRIPVRWTSYPESVTRSREL